MWFRYNFGQGTILFQTDWIPVTLNQTENVYNTPSKCNMPISKQLTCYSNCYTQSSTTQDLATRQTAPLAQQPMARGRRHGSPGITRAATASLWTASRIWMLWLPCQQLYWLKRLTLMGRVWTLITILQITIIPLKSLEWCWERFSVRLLSKG